MHASYSDVIVHLPRALDAAARQRLERALESERGVTRAKGSSHADRLMVVNYDPQLISALGVLRTVRAHGFRARLVGM
jgi:hypothetical protein